MDEEAVALLRAHTPVVRGYEATTRTIDGVAILAEELSDILQALDSLNGKLTIRTRTDIEQEVAVLACCTHQLTDEGLLRLIVLVRDAIAPSVVHRQAGLQRELADILSTQTVGILTGEVLLEDLDILTRIGLAMVVVGNDTLGLELVNHGILLIELPVERGLVLIMVPPSVEPDTIDTTVVGE